MKGQKVYECKAKCEELLETDDQKQIGAIIGVDLYGLPCNYKGLNALSKKYDIPVLIDSAQSLGTKLNGRLVGKNCLMHSFSFHTTKPFPTLEGGFVSSNDEYLIEKIKRLRKGTIERGEERKKEALPDFRLSEMTNKTTDFD